MACVWHHLHCTHRPNTGALHHEFWLSHADAGNMPRSELSVRSAALHAVRASAAHDRQKGMDRVGHVTFHPGWTSGGSSRLQTSAWGRASRAGASCAPQPPSSVRKRLQGTSDPGEPLHWDLVACEKTDGCALVQHRQGPAQCIHRAWPHAPQHPAGEACLLLRKRPWGSRVTHSELHHTLPCLLPTACASQRLARRAGDCAKLCKLSKHPICPSGAHAACTDCCMAPCRRHARTGCLQMLYGWCWMESHVECLACRG